MQALHRTEVDGVPVWWAPQEGPLRASLAFRVGVADEPLARRGITHLAEHLILFPLGRQAYAYNASTMDHDTIFDVSGEPDEVAAHLRRVTDGIAQLPRERFGEEVRVLLVESMDRGRSLSTRLRQARFGARTYGLRGKQELGLRTAGPDDVQAWARSHMTAGNAVLWMTGEPPAGLELRLPPGERAPMPPADPLPRLVLPAYLHDDEGAVAVTLVGSPEDAETLRTVAAVARQRLHDELRRERALVYSVDMGHGVVGAGGVHVRVEVACRDEDALEVRDALLATLDALATDGPTAEELAFEADQTRRYLEDPASLESRLGDAALDELHGMPVVPDEERLAIARALTPAACAEAVRRALPSRIVLVPETLDAPPPDGVTPYEIGRPQGEAPAGRAFRELDDTECAHRPCVLTVGEHALHWRAGDGSAEALVPFAEVAAVAREAGDQHVFITTDDRTYEFTPLAFHDGDALREALVAAVGIERVVPPDDRGRRVDARAVEDLDRVELVSEELYRLSEDLTDDEEVLALAEAEDMDGPGLLAVTGRRVIWHYVARGAEGDEDGRNGIEHAGLARVEGAAGEDGLGVLRMWVRDAPDDEEPITIERIVRPGAAERLADAIRAAAAR